MPVPGRCHLPDDPAHAAPGLDYTLTYWFGVHYGLLPGGGPYVDSPSLLWRGANQDP